MIIIAGASAAPSGAACRVSLAASRAARPGRISRAGILVLAHAVYITAVLTSRRTAAGGRTLARWRWRWLLGRRSVGLVRPLTLSGLDRSRQRLWRNRTCLRWISNLRHNVAGAGCTGLISKTQSVAHLVLKALGQNVGRAAAYSRPARHQRLGVDCDRPRNNVELSARLVVCGVEPGRIV
jgi:hypothetical protein